MTYLLLFWEFFKTGLFSVGGGYAAMPFLYEIAAKYDWYSEADLANYIAIAEVTPGPVGINTATFAGFAAGGIAGGLIATLSLVLPAFLLITALNKFAPDFKESAVTDRLLYGLLPVAVALIAVAGLRLAGTVFVPLGLSWQGFWALLLFAGLLVLGLVFKKGPLWLLLTGAVWGLIFL